MEPQRGLHIRARHSAMRAALAQALSHHFPHAVAAVDEETEPKHGDVVIAARDTASLASVRSAAEKGIRVIVLTPDPRSDDRRAYRAAGAHGYLPMEVDLPRLVAVVAAALA